jgi:hypothetical protein
VSGGVAPQLHVGNSGEEDFGSGSEISPCGCAETNARHGDGGVDGGGGDGSELKGWGRVGVGDGKRRGVVAAKMVSRRVKRDVTRSEVGADAGAREVAGMSWEENNCSVGDRWQRLAEPSVL